MRSDDIPLGEQTVAQVSCSSCVQQITAIMFLFAGPSVCQGTTQVVAPQVSKVGGGGDLRSSAFLLQFYVTIFILYNSNKGIMVR